MESQQENIEPSTPTTQDSKPESETPTKPSETRSKVEVTLCLEVEVIGDDWSQMEHAEMACMAAAKQVKEKFPMVKARVAAGQLFDVREI